MGILVTDKVTKAGSWSSNIVKIIVAKTDPGYSSNPGHLGTVHSRAVEPHS
jgi:hypothetical protein